LEKEKTLSQLSLPRPSSREAGKGARGKRDIFGGGGQIRTVDAADMSHDDSAEDC